MEDEYFSSLLEQDLSEAGIAEFVSLYNEAKEAFVRLGMQANDFYILDEESPKDLIEQLNEKNQGKDFYAKEYVKKLVQVFQLWYEKLSGPLVVDRPIFILVRLSGHRDGYEIKRGLAKSIGKNGDIYIKFDQTSAPPSSFNINNVFMSEDDARSELL